MTAAVERSVAAKAADKYFFLIVIGLRENSYGFISTVG